MNKAPKPTTSVYQWTTVYPSRHVIIELQLVSKTDKTATFQYDQPRIGCTTRRENLTLSRPLFESWAEARDHMVGGMFATAGRLEQQLTAIRAQIEYSRNLKDPTK